MTIFTLFFTCIVCLFYRSLWIYLKAQRKFDVQKQAAYEKMLSSHSAMFVQYAKILELKDILIASRDKEITIREEQIEKYVTMIDNLSNVSDDEDEEETEAQFIPDTALSEYNKIDSDYTEELVAASHSQFDKTASLFDQRSAKANAAVQLYIARTEVEKDKDSMPKETYEKLMNCLKHRE